MKYLDVLEIASARISPRLPWSIGQMHGRRHLDLLHPETGRQTFFATGILPSESDESFLREFR